MAPEKVKQFRHSFLLSLSEALETVLCLFNCPESAGSKQTEVSFRQNCIVLACTFPSSLNLLAILLLLFEPLKRKLINLPVTCLFGDQTLAEFVQDC
jgi:hypothetical protein